jgi:asparagine synthase (glutamine-hydrolysing)
MGAQFGIWNFDGSRTPEPYLDRARTMIAPYGPDGDSHYRGGPVDILYSRFSTTEQISPQQQPTITPSGAVLVWDGRLDNVSELALELRLSSSSPLDDAVVAVAAYEHWKGDCLKHFTGDWSLTVWEPHDRSLLLATDVLGVRHIYYLVRPDYVLWGSVLDPLVFLADHKLSLDEEYLAGWLGSFPAPHLTPFHEIRRVPSASMVSIRQGGIAIRRYWDFDGTRRIRYTRDEEYEKHFLELLRQAVRRRLRSNAPVLAELSGGMDSSAIVCIADQLTSDTGEPKVETISRYNDYEPHWNERPWFTRVEAHRGRSGLHVDVNALPPETEAEKAHPRFRPGAGAVESPMVEFMIRRGLRVLLSGIGGDEFLGGVPTPVPELEDLFARGKLFSLWQRMQAWALVQQRPWIHLIRDTARGFLPSFPARFHGQTQIPWLLPDFVSRQNRALGGYRRRMRWVGDLPSFQENAQALDGIRRQLACMDLSPGYPFERRYPFLDRDLLEFLFAIPREQLVRPGHRRSLMRRALRNIVPQAVLDRRRKAFISRAPIQLAQQHLGMLATSGRLASEEAGIVDSAQYRASLEAACAGRNTPLVPLLRTINIEEWLQELGRCGLLSGRIPSTPSRVLIGETTDNQIPELHGNGEAAPCRL